MLAEGYGVTGTTYDFFAFNAAGEVYNGVSFVAWADVDFADYRIPAVEVGTSRRYTATLPDETVAYVMRFRGATLADSYEVWSGTAAGGLTPGQLADAISAAIVAGGVPSAISPIGEGGTITLYTGVDYTENAAGYLIVPIPDLVQGRAPAVGEAVFFQGRHCSADPETFEASGEVIERASDPTKRDAQIEILRSDMSAITKIDSNWLYFVGDRPPSLQDSFMAAKLILKHGPASIE